VVFPDPNIDNGKLAYRRFQRMAGPDCAKDRLWCFFRHAGVPFFLADTRTERGVPRPGDGRPDPRRVDNWRRARIMKDGQRDALRAFLRADEHRGRVRFVVSPAMLFPRGFGLDVEESLALERDGWDGFPASMNELLAFLCDEDLERVVFLSGDAHTSLVARAVITHANHRVTVWSVHSSGLYCPYPFINDTADFYPDHEDYTFASPQNPNPDYRAVVDLVRAVPGDGFATLKLVDLAKGHQALRLHFHRDDCVKDLDIQF
jgi:hypothetical protein